MRGDVFRALSNHANADPRIDALDLFTACEGCIDSVVSRHQHEVKASAPQSVGNSFAGNRLHFISLRSQQRFAKSAIVTRDQENR